MSDIDSKEIDNVRKAFLNWVETQEISTMTFSVVMSDLLADMVGMIAESPKELEEGIRLQNNLLGTRARLAFERKKQW